MDLVKILHLKGIGLMLSEMLFFKKMLRKYRKVMKKGKYSMFPTMRAIVVDDIISVEQANKYFLKADIVSRKAKFIEALNKCSFFHNYSCGKQQYDALYVANNYDKSRDVKLFSFENNKIITICASREDMEKQMAVYESLHGYYKMPNISRNDYFENSYEISMVDLKPRPQESHALNNILSSAMNEKNRECKKESVARLLSYNYNDEMTVALYDIYCKISPDILHSDIPIIEQHGDLSRDNLIYGKADGDTAFWWIDWEHISDRVFLYDYFFYIFNTAFYYHDTSAFDVYINGANNEELKKYFGYFGVEFCDEKLKEYFYVFLIAFLKERICDRGYEDVLKEYLTFLKEIKLLS